MTGRINFSPEAERQLNDLDDWIAARSTADIARVFVSAILEHIDSVLVFPFAGRARDDVRPGMRTITYKKRTLIAYEVDESSGDLVVNVVGVFHGGQNWEAALSDGEDAQEAAD
jgi:toxin ParE1/3/4